MNVVRWLAAMTGAALIVTVVDMTRKEFRARLDRLPFAILRLARTRLPTELRERVHDQEWLPELQHILEHAKLFPLTRLITGIRYAAGLFMRAGTVAAELLPPDATRTPASGAKAACRRLAARSAGALHTLVWPTREPLRVRVYVVAVTTAAIAAMVAAATSTTIHGHDLELIAILLPCYIATQRKPRTRVTLHLELTDVWILPTAILLPPVYALIAPACGRAIVHWRTPGHAYRRVFSAAANGLAFGAISVLAHALAPLAAGHAIPPAVTPLGWAVLIVECELLAALGVNTFILSAIKASTPGTKIRPLIADGTLARSQLAILALGTAATFIAAAYPLLVIPLVPLVIRVQKYTSAWTPAPPANAVD